MNTILVAYNDYGDLVAEAYTYGDLIWRVECAGYDEHEVFIGSVTP